MKSLMKYCGGWLGCVVVISQPGCARLSGVGPVSVVRQTQAVLAASGEQKINMFGDLPDGTAPRFFARAAISLRRHTFGEVGRDFDPDIIPAGDRIVFASTRHNIQPAIYMKSVDGVAVTQLTTDPGADIQPAFSPDGTRIAFASDRAGNWDIWILDLRGGPPVQVTTGDADEVHPSWSPDGTQLVFCSLSVMSGQWELWLADAALRVGKRFIGFGLFPEWSPVEDTIVFQRAREQGSRWFSIWSITLVAGEPHYATELAASSREALILPSWSPDGRRITYSSAGGMPTRSTSSVSTAEQGPFDIWIMNSDGTGNIRTTDGMTRNFSPTFATDGRVFFTSDRTGFENIWSLLPSSAGPGIGSADSMTADGAPDKQVKRQVQVRKAAARDGS